MRSLLTFFLVCPSELLEDQKKKKRDPYPIGEERKGERDRCNNE